MSGGDRSARLDVRLRAETDLIEAIDAVLERLRRERPGANVTRSDAVRVLLREAITARGLVPAPANAGGA